MDGLQLRAFGTRLDGELLDEVKMRAALRRMSVQDITDEAMRMWLTSDAKRRRK